MTSREGDTIDQHKIQTVSSSSASDGTISFILAFSGNRGGCRIDRPAVALDSVVVAGVAMLTIGWCHPLILGPSGRLMVQSTMAGGPWFWVNKIFHVNINLAQQAFHASYGNMI